MPEVGSTLKVAAEHVLGPLRTPYNIIQWAGVVRHRVEVKGTPDRNHPNVLSDIRVRVHLPFFPNNPVMIPHLTGLITFPAWCFEHDKSRA